MVLNISGYKYVLVSLHLRMISLGYILENRVVDKHVFDEMFCQITFPNGQAHLYSERVYGRF